MTGPWVDSRSRTCMDVLCQSPQNPARLEPMWNPSFNSLAVPRNQKAR